MSDQNEFKAHLEIDYILDWDLSSEESLDHLDNELRSVCYGDFVPDLDSVKSIVRNGENSCFSLKAATTLSFSDFKDLFESFTNLDFGELDPNNYLNLQIKQGDEIIFEEAKAFEQDDVKIEDVLKNAEKIVEERSQYRTR